MAEFIQNMFAQRLGGSSFGEDDDIYKFEKIKRAKDRATRENPGVELIDLGVGEPDETAYPGILERLKREAPKHENRGYADNGIQEFKDAAARYMDNVYGVQIDPESEVLHSIGSKSALAMFPLVFINPGDVVLSSTPGYPVLGTLSSWLGGRVVELPLREENDFLPDLDEISEEDARAAKLMYVNYPNNPTGAVANREFYREVVDFAREHEIVVVQDAAYAALTFDGREPLSFLSVPGAKEVGVEIHSLSKAFNMTGWRLAFVAGNEKIVKGFGHVKDNMDSGQFKAIQKAGVYALDHPEITREIADKYSRRLDLLTDALQDVGFDARKPRGSFYMYVNIPRGVRGGPRFESAEDFSQYLIREKLISTVPWDDVGSYIRLSATFVCDGPEDEERVISEVKRRLEDLDLEF